jgi:cell division control protein 45
MESNDFLWLAIVGVSSMELYGRSVTGVGVTPSGAGPNVWGGQRGERITQVLRDEVRRLNPPDPEDLRNGTEATGIMPTTARSSTDNSIKLSPEPRFLLVRHWSLYDSMLHSPYLAARLHVWTEKGKRRLNKLLATMGISIQQCKQNYTHMELDLKRGLREKLLKYAPIYGLEGLVPPDLTAGRGREGWGFVRSWGWKACLSAVDVGVIVGAMLEVKQGVVHSQNNNNNRNEEVIVVDEEGIVEAEEYVRRFWHAYDALEE